MEADFFNKKLTSTEPFDTDVMAREFLMQFPKQSFTVGQEIVFKFQDKKLLLLMVKDIEAANLTDALRGGTGTAPKKIHLGFLIGNSQVIFDKADTSSLNLTGKSKG